METSRKTALAALALLFVSQFFQYTSSGQTTMTIDFSTHLISGGLPYGGETGWGLHAWWFHLPLCGLFAYLLYTAPRSVGIYWAGLVLFIIMGLGNGFGGTLGIISIAIYGYAIYKKTKEGASEKAVNQSTNTTD